MFVWHQLSEATLTIASFSRVISVGIGDLCQLLNLVKELIGFECLKKSGVISRHEVHS